MCKQNGLRFVSTVAHREEPAMSFAFRCWSLLFSFCPIALALAAEDAPLAGTSKLTMEGDIASALVDGVDRFLLKELDKSVERRAAFWKRDLSSAEAYNASIEPNRKRLAHILGV